MHWSTLRVLLATTNFIGAASAAQVAPRIGPVYDAQSVGSALTATVAEIGRTRGRGGVDTTALNSARRMFWSAPTATRSAESRQAYDDLLRQRDVFLLMRSIYSELRENSSLSQSISALVERFPQGFDVPPPAEEEFNAWRIKVIELGRARGLPDVIGLTGESYLKYRARRDLSEFLALSSTSPLNAVRVTEFEAGLSVMNGTFRTVTEAVDSLRRGQISILTAAAMKLIADRYGFVGAMEVYQPVTSIFEDRVRRHDEGNALAPVRKFLVESVLRRFDGSLVPQSSCTHANPDKRDICLYDSKFATTEIADAWAASATPKQGFEVRPSDALSAPSFKSSDEVVTEFLRGLLAEEPPLVAGMSVDRRLQKLLDPSRKEEVLRAARFVEQYGVVPGPWNTGRFSSYGLGMAVVQAFSAFALLHGDTQTLAIAVFAEKDNRRGLGALESGIASYESLTQRLGRSAVDAAMVKLRPDVMRTSMNGRLYGNGLVLSRASSSAAALGGASQNDVQQALLSLVNANASTMQPAVAAASVRASQAVRVSPKRGGARRQPELDAARRDLDTQRAVGNASRIAELEAAVSRLEESVRIEYAQVDSNTVRGLRGMFETVRDMYVVKTKEVAAFDSLGSYYHSFLKTRSSADLQALAATRAAMLKRLADVKSNPAIPEFGLKIFLQQSLSVVEMWLDELAPPA